MFGPRSARERWPKKLDQCNERIHTLEGNIQSLATEVEALRASVQGFEKEISDAGAAMANLRENIRVRKLMRDIATTTAEIESLDMEEAAKAKRIFQEKYSIEKEKETQMQSKVVSILLPMLMGKSIIDFSMRISAESSVPLKHN